MTFRLEDFIRCRNFLITLNQTKLEDLRIYHEGCLISIPKEQIEEWRFMGLSNDWFVDCVLVNDELSRSVTTMVMTGEDEHNNSGAHL